jgi:hypothetical protein
VKTNTVIALTTDEGGTLDVTLGLDRSDRAAWIRIEPNYRATGHIIDSVGFRGDRRKELRAFARALLAACEPKRRLARASNPRRRG